MARWSDAFPTYVSAAERRARVQRRLKALARSGRAPSPVVVEGKEIATTFWGKAWCDAIESHADLATRLPRGRSYVRSGCVLDLRIETGEVRAVVSGTEPYDATIRIAPLARRRWEAVRKACAGRIGTVVELLSGKLSSRVMEVLCDRDGGLFPATAELDMTCSCPDSAWLCKHLAAVLYGIGARLDAAPELLFTLRGVALEELVSAAGQADAFAGTGGAALPDERLAELFGIELETGPGAPLPEAPRPRRGKRGKRRKAKAKARGKRRKAR